MKVEQGFLYNVKILWSKSAVKLRLQFKIFEKKKKKKTKKVMIKRKAHTKKQFKDSGMFLLQCVGGMYIAP